MSDTAKVKPPHTQRAAVIYVRQSNPAQVEHNRESTERQYALVQRALDLAWRRDQITLVDDDLGVSADGIAKRAGFAQLTAEVALLKVGIVVGLEVRAWPVVLLREVIRGLQRLQLGHVDVQTPEPPVLVGLRLDVEPPPQVLPPDGRHCQVAPAFHVVGGIAEQQGPFAPRALPRLIAPAGPSATLSPSAAFPGNRLYGLPRSADFAAGRGGLLPWPDVSCAPCRRSHPAGGDSSRQPDCDDPCCLRA